MVLAPVINNGEGGRPYYDRDFLTADLLQWVQDPDNWDIKKWRIRYKLPRDTVMRMCDDSTEFSDAYKYAFDVIAARREEMNHNDEMKDSLYGLHSRVYDKDLDAQKKAEKKFEIEVKQAMLEKELQTVSTEINEKYDAVIGQLSSLQKERKIADNNINAEAKS